MDPRLPPTASATYCLLTSRSQSATSTPRLPARAARTALSSSAQGQSLLFYARPPSSR